MRVLQHIAISLCGLLLLTGNAAAETSLDIRAGIDLGGTTPLPLPAEIRVINGYSPLLRPAVEAGATSFISDRWGLRAALRFEIKGMTTSATVKSYSMVITGDDGNSLSGYWTGDVDTQVSNTLLTVPVNAAFKASEKFSIYLGPYVSFLLKGRFGGDVYNGYLREGSPVGEKISFCDGASNSYEFSDDYKRVQLGVSLAADYNINRHILLTAGLNWGLSNVFKSSFKTISFNMYPIYGNIAVGYRF